MEPDNYEAQLDADLEQQLNEADPFGQAAPVVPANDMPPAPVTTIPADTPRARGDGITSPMSSESPRYTLPTQEQRMGLSGDALSWFTGTDPKVAFDKAQFDYALVDFAGQFGGVVDYNNPDLARKALESQAGFLALNESDQQSVVDVLTGKNALYVDPTVTGSLADAPKKEVQAEVAGAKPPPPEAPVVSMKERQTIGVNIKAQGPVLAQVWKQSPADKPGTEDEMIDALLAQAGVDQKLWQDSGIRTTARATLYTNNLAGDQTKAFESQKNNPEAALLGAGASESWLASRSGVRFKNSVADAESPKEMQKLLGDAALASADWGRQIDPANDNFFWFKRNDGTSGYRVENILSSVAIGLSLYDALYAGPQAAEDNMRFQLDLYDRQVQDQMRFAILNNRLATQSAIKIKQTDEGSKGPAPKAPPAVRL